MRGHPGSRPGYPRRVAYVIAVIAGLVFGAGDQYLGTLAAGSFLGTWSWTVSGMSAPWVIAPFLAGMTQDRSRRAIKLGLVVTLSALAGYFAMSHSPMEGAALKEFWPRVVRMITTGFNPAWIAAGLVTGPLFGFLGNRWRVARWWVSAAAFVGSLCLEPLARLPVGMLSANPIVWAAEVATGAIAAAWFVHEIANGRRVSTQVASVSGK
jgi:Family of unknown function (DUF6518)